MALTRIETQITYRSGGGGVFYHFEVVMDQNNNITVRNILTPTGLMTDSMVGLPQSVLDDIETAIGQLEDLVAQTSSVGGILTYAAETTQSVTFSTPFSSTSYRVQVSVEDFITYRIRNKTLTGFDIELGIEYTGDVGYDVFV